MTRTTLSAAVAVDDKRVTLASITGLAVGSIILVNGERMRVTAVPSAATAPVDVLRGISGTKPVAHPITSGVAFGTPDEFSHVSTLPGRTRDIRAYTAAGAITLPTPGRDMVAILNGTDALAMTIADPGKDNDGDILIIVGNGKAAHTVTYTAGWGDAGSGADVGTFDANGQGCMQFIAANETWVPLPSPFSGTLTAFDVASA